MEPNLKLRPYKKSDDRSQCFGVFPTLELFRHRPEAVRGVVAHSKGLENRGLKEVRERCRRQGVPFEVDDRVVERLTRKGNTYLVASFEKYEATIDPGANHLLLVAPSDHGNLGAILRTALGFGVRDVALVDPAPDAFHPRVVRASMGALFAQSVQTFADLGAYRRKFAARRCCLALRPAGGTRLDRVAIRSPYTLIFGPEGAGLAAGEAAWAEGATIPQSPLVDSFNLAVAVGVALYQATVSTDPAM